jgi:D-alanyl-D-alanine carboxypeptidase (penicillin-binding protein 5/6)
MSTRRSLLLAGAVMLPGAALAQAPKKPPPRPAAPARAKKPEAPAGSPATTPLGPLDTAARFAVALDHVTGATLLDKDADVAMTPSSMTKLMTAYIVYSMLKSGRLKLDQTLLVSERAWRMGGSKMFVQVGTEVKVEDLIRGMIVQSGNDACIVLAEAIAGSEEQFAELMNAEGRKMGLLQSNFRNATGWPDPAHRMSARDIAVVARRLITDFPDYYKYDSEKSFKYNNIDQPNRNPLVQKNLADGMKTGHTDDGGYGLVASALRGGRRVILVVNGLTSMHQRGEEGERLLDWCFREFENVTLFTAADTVESVPVWLGTSPKLPLVVGRDVVVTLPKSWRGKTKVQLAYETPVRAPVQRGTALGRLTVTGTGMSDVELPLLAGVDVPRLGLVGRAGAVLSRMVLGS